MNVQQAFERLAELIAKGYGKAPLMVFDGEDCGVVDINELPLVELKAMRGYTDALYFSPYAEGNRAPEHDHVVVLVGYDGCDTGRLDT